MKKILFGSGAAIFAVVGLSSFKSIHHLTGPHYFLVKSQFNTLSNSGATFANVQLTYLAADSGYCNNGTGSFYDCVVTFTQHVNAAGTKLTAAAIVSSTIYTRKHS